MVKNLSRFIIVMAVCFMTSALSYAQPDLVALVKKVKPTVVAIYTFNNQGQSLMQGSGFFIGTHGEVISNWHVIEGANSAVVKTFDGSSYLVKQILGGNKESDLVFLSVDTRNNPIQTLPIADSTPEIGERVLVVGNPLSLEFSVSDGIVAAIRDIPEYPSGKVIQITAPVSPGSSGSPVINMRGEAIAVAFYVYFKGENLNFAIPGQRVKDIVTNPNQSPISLSELSGNNFKTFQNPLQGFMVTYPQNWEPITQNYQNQIINGFLAPLDDQTDLFRENLNVIIDTFQSPILLETYYQWNLSQLKNFPDIQFLKNYDGTLSSLPSKILVYTRLQNGKGFTFSQVYAVRGNKGCVLTFTAESDKYQKYQPIFQQILSRFSFNSNF